MKRIISLSVALLMACVAFAQNITDSYRPGGFDYNGASIKTFSVSDNTAVQFSRGNLQYNPSLDKWRFALRQYSTACGDNANASETYDGWIDLFGWGTSGWNSGATAYKPWSTSENYEQDYNPGGSYENSLTGAYANADWGIYNKIENGGKYAGMWRTLTADEWQYLLLNHSRGFATIQGVYKGLVILPDDWTLPEGLTFDPSYSDGYGTNQYTIAEWQRMEAAGAIFLPAAGLRTGSELSEFGVYGEYWTSSVSSSVYVLALRFWTGNISAGYGEYRNVGRSVRLVRRVQKPLVQKGWVDMGLPSGTLWYSCNIGTTKPQGYGAYFAWGETKPKADYSWDTYKYGTSETSLTKYCQIADNGLDGFTDGLTTLQSGDDAATVALGGGARMPTETEWQELLDNCTSEWTKYNGVNGYMLTSNANGTRLFLPAAGYRDGSSLDLAGERGYYWSSSLSTDYPYDARSFFFNSGGSDVGYDYFRGDGQSVRPVRGGVEPQQESLADAFDENGASIKTFSVSATSTVHFSKGNLWYNAAANLWRFAPEQYEYIGANNSNISETYNDYIDLFGWGTSGWSSGAVAYQPWATSESYSDYYPGGSATNNLTGDYANADWGVYNPIEDGGNQAGMWRTMTKDEWEYLLNTRNASTVSGTDNARYAIATIVGTAGLIILPDDFTMPDGVNALVNINTTDANFTNNSYTTEQWMKLELAGAIFLPAAGYRMGTNITDAGEYGNYWASTSSNEEKAGFMLFFNGNVATSDYTRKCGHSVRLVKD